MLTPKESATSFDAGQKAPQKLEIIGVTKGAAAFVLFENNCVAKAPPEAKSS